MDITLRIERLILNDLSLSPSQRARLQEIIEGELADLLTTQGVPTPLQQGGTIAKLPAPVQIDSKMSLPQMGKQIAQSIYEEMGEFKR